MSRDWYLCSRRLLRRELVYDSHDRQQNRNRDSAPVDQVWRSKLPRAEVLHLIIQSSHRDFDQEWSSLYPIIQSGLEQSATTGNSTAPGCKLKELTLTDERIHYKIHNLDLHMLLPSFSGISLTTLRLKLGNFVKTMNMDAFFMWLPHLEVLTIESSAIYSGHPFGMDWSDADIRSVIDMNLNRGRSFNSDWREQQLVQPLVSSNLRALRFDGVFFPTGVLEAILELSPRLKHLHLKKISCQDISSDETPSSALMLLLGHHPNLGNLETLVLPKAKTVSREGTMALVSRFGHLLQTWTCYTEDFSEFFRALMNPGPETLPWKSTMPPLKINFVTSLILSTGSWSQTQEQKHPRIGPALHQFLCVSPLLESLDARSISFAVEELDIFGQFFQQISPEMEKQRSQSKETWVCKRLKTLCISFYSRTGARIPLSSEERRRRELENPRNSRLVFGYLTRFTPALEELDMQVGMTNMDLCWGLPILSRLQKMVRLMVYFLCELPERTAYEEIRWLKVGGLTALDDQEWTSATELEERGYSMQKKSYRWGDMELVGDNEDDREFRLREGELKTLDESSGCSWRDPNWATMGTMEDVTLALDEIRENDRQLLDQQRLQKQRWPSLSTLVKGNSRSRLKRWPEMTGLCFKDIENRAHPLPRKAQDLAGLTEHNNTCRFF